MAKSKKQKKAAVKTKQKKAAKATGLELIVPKGHEKFFKDLIAHYNSDVGGIKANALHRPVTSRQVTHFGRYRGITPEQIIKILVDFRAANHLPNADEKTCTTFVSTFFANRKELAAKDTKLNVQGRVVVEEQPRKKKKKAA